MADFRWVDQGTGFRHSLTISPASLPLFPGHIAIAFQALQGPTLSPVELSRRIRLLYHGRTEGDLWKNAAAAAHDVRCKVTLPPHLQLLLELDDLPRNEWEKITFLWSTSAEPLSSISPGIRLNPQGFAGLDNYDIDTADLICMWASGNVKQISRACGQQRDHSDVRNAFHIALTSPNIWSPAALSLQPWTPSTNIKRLRYVGTLEPTVIADWLRNEVGLNSHNVFSCFKPFSPRAFDTDAKTNPRKHSTDLDQSEIYSGSTDDSLPDLGDNLDWTLAHRPKGPPLKARDSNISQGTADASDVPMEG
jgi:hypothetical protein